MPGLTGLSGTSGLSGLMGSGGYIQKVLGYDPIAYWVLNETAGATAVDQVNSPAQDGAYTGVTLGQTVTDANGISFVCPLFDGVNDYVDIYSVIFDGVFDGTEGTVASWVRPFNAGVWTDATTRYLWHLLVNANNYIRLTRSIVNNRISWRYRANATNEDVVKNGANEVIWIHQAITWSSSDDEVICYWRGSQEGLTQNGLGAWAGALSNVQTLIGARTQVPNDPWHGWIAHVAVWNSALTAPEIADLATV